MHFTLTLLSNFPMITPRHLKTWFVKIIFQQNNTNKFLKKRTLYCRKYIPVKVTLPDNKSQQQHNKRTINPLAH